MVGIETPWVVKSADMLLLAYLDGRVVRYRSKTVNCSLKALLRHHGYASAPSRYSSILPLKLR